MPALLLYPFSALAVRDAQPLPARRPALRHIELPRPHRLVLLEERIHDRLERTLRPRATVAREGARSAVVEGICDAHEVVGSARLSVLAACQAIVAQVVEDDLGSRARVVGDVAEQSFLIVDAAPDALVHLHDAHRPGG